MNVRNRFGSAGVDADHEHYKWWALSCTSLGMLLVATNSGTLGEESTPFWRDHMGAGVNAIRTQTLIRTADIVVVRFGDKYRQWNAAFDAGYAAALGKPIVTLHDVEIDHALKEVDRAAQASARTAEQVVGVLRYVISGELPG